MDTPAAGETPPAADFSLDADLAPPPLPADSPPVAEPAPIPTPPPPAAPVTEEARQAPLDVLRGVAVLGILYMNIQNFSMIDSAYSNPTAYGDLTGANFLVWLVGALFFHGKFIATFSMLFGAGMVLLQERLRATGRPAFAVHLRRTIALLLIGFAHGRWLWSGDILFHYAVAGLLLYPVQRLRARWLIPLGLLFVAIETLIGLGFDHINELEPDPPGRYSRHEFNPPPFLVEMENNIFRGTWQEQQEWRGTDANVQQLLGVPFGTFWWCGGLMMIGTALYKTGYFTAWRRPRLYIAAILFALLIALPATAYEVWRNFHLGWDSTEVELHYNLINNFACIPMAIGIAAVVMLWCQRRLLRTGTLAPRTDRAIVGLSLYDRLSATGRMAFTNYLMQTVICTTLFYGHGFGLYGYVERWGQFFIVLAIWLLQLFWSPLWLRYFRFGPAEWLWRSMTYLRPQPILRGQPQGAAPTS